MYCNAVIRRSSLGRAGTSSRLRYDHRSRRRMGMSSVMTNIAAVAQAIIAVMMLALVAVAVVIALRVRRTLTRVDELVERVSSGTAPLVGQLKEIKALLEVVQEEAQDLFVSVASTVRGVQQGAAQLRRPRRPSGMDLASDESDAADALEAADDDIESEEHDDDDDDASRSAAHEEAVPAPRIRSHSSQSGPGHRGGPA